MFFCNVHRVLTSVLAVPLAERFGFSMLEMGFLQSSFLWGYGLFQLPAGLIADAYGGVAAMPAGLAVWSLCTVVVPVASLAAGADSQRLALAALMASRCLMGVASAVALPAVNASTSRIVSAEKKGGVLSMIYAAFNTGTVAGLVAIPRICEVVGWEKTFTMVGAAGVGAAIAAAAALKMFLRQDKKTEGTAVQGLMTTQLGVPPTSETVTVSSSLASASEESGGALSPSSSSSTSSSSGGGGGGVGAIDFVAALHALDRPKLLQLFGLLWTHSVIGWGFFVLLNWIPTYLAKSQGTASISSAGALAALPWCCSVVAAFAAGRLSDYLIVTRQCSVVSVRTFAALVSSIGPGLALVIASLTNPNLVTILGLLSFALACLAFSYSGFHAYLQDVSGRRAGSLLSLTNLSGILMGICGNVLSGWLMQVTGSFSPMFFISGCMFISSGVLWMILMKGQVIFDDKDEDGKAVLRTQTT